MTNGITYPMLYGPVIMICTPMFLSIILMILMKYTSTKDLAHSLDKWFNDIGDYQQCVVVQDAMIVPCSNTLNEEVAIDHIVYDHMISRYSINNIISGPSVHTTNSKTIQFDHLQPSFGLLPSDIIQ
jgi:hypothetical protein